MAKFTIKEAKVVEIRKSIFILPFKNSSIFHCELFQILIYHSAIDAATSSPTTKIPGFVFVAVNKTGQEIISHASGHRGAETSEPMTLDSVFWIASCTKMVAGIACMQLVEQGKLSLDDAASVEEIAPELKRAKILKGFDENNKPILEDKKTGITLRMLLTHTG
jgi:CubicO group peptidase (beta-lactamase class C family)